VELLSRDVRDGIRQQSPRSSVFTIKEFEIFSVNSYYMTQTHCILVSRLLASLFSPTDFIVTCF
jgi:hypothetical protein